LLGRRQIEACAAAIQELVETSYLELAAIQRRGHPSYFAEKMLPSDIQYIAWELYPGAREIILVRDFRDVICSIDAFNRKRGFPSFGREDAQSDVEFVEGIRFGAQQLVTRWQERRERALLLHYERLVLDPVATLQTIFDYVGVRGTNAERIVESSLQDQFLKDHTTTRTAKASIGRWRRDLSEDLQGLCNELLAEPLNAFGYGEEGDLLSRRLTSDELGGSSVAG
jgi:hypothetical protein